MNSVRLFTLAGAERRNAAVERWFADAPVELGPLARKWFREMRASGPDVLELLHDGHPTACVGDLALGYVNAFADHINVGFYFGAVLPDASRLLEGTGRYMRHVKICPGAFGREAELQLLLRDAYLDIARRLAARQA